MEIVKVAWNAPEVGWIFFYLLREGVFLLSGLGLAMFSFLNVKIDERIVFSLPENRYEPSKKVRPPTVGVREKMKLSCWVVS